MRQCRIHLKSQNEKTTSTQVMVRMEILTLCWWLHNWFDMLKNT